MDDSLKIYDGEDEILCDEMTKDLMLRMGCSETAAELCGLAVGTQANGNVCLGPLDDAECAVLKAAPVVACFSDGDDAFFVKTPFILNGRLLYSRRNWIYEQTIKKRVLEMAAKICDSVSVPNDGAFKNLNERQRAAVEMMCGNRFSILTGGPGTGKTFTIARAVKLSLEKETLRLGLAAPTGKAAARVKESMTNAANDIGLDEIPPATTIHSLLEPNHDLVSFKHNRENPLPLDWLIVDEASMIDLPLMAKLLDALKPDCRLTLVGDANQLASVEPGRVFGDLCRMDGIAKCELNESRRFPAGGEIERLAAAVNEKRPQDALDIMRKQSNELVIYNAINEKYADNPEKWGTFAKVVKEHFHEFSIQTDAGNALERLNDCRILCAMRHGPYGVKRLNAFMCKALGDKSPIPMMITENNHSLGVNNGDVGVVMPRDNCLSILLEDGTIRRIPLPLLPSLEMAFASTIHKAQGSEYKDVVIVLPPNPKLHDSHQDNPLLTREILYTAITRTQKKVFLYGSDASVEQCCNNAVHRQTGLA